MAAANANAYEFSRFEDQPRNQAAPRVRVAKGKSRKANHQLRKMLRTLVLCSIVVALVCGVLYTQTTITELQSKIARMDTELMEQRTVNVYLNSELEKLVNLRNLDERAQELGLVYVDNSKYNYIRVSDGEPIKVKKSTLEQLLEDMENGFLNILDYFES